MSNSPQQIIGAFTNRTRSLLAQPEWLRGPWIIHAKSPKDLLMDIMIEVPEVMEKHDRLQVHADGSHFVENVQILIKHCEDLVACLDAWRRSDAGAVVSKLESRPMASFRCLSYREVNIASLHLSNLYWVTGLILASTISSLYLHLSIASAFVTGSGDFRSSTHFKLAHKLAQRVASEYASKISETLPLFFRETSSNFEKTVGLFPLTSLLQHFGSPANQTIDDYKTLHEVITRITRGSYVAMYAAEKLPTALAAIENRIKAVDTSVGIGERNVAHESLSIIVVEAMRGSDR